MDRLVVVKVLTAVDAEATRRRFDRERKAMGRLSQAPGIAPLYRSGFTPGGQPWLLMPYYENGSLQNVIDASGPMDPERVREIGVRVSRAVHAAHESGVLHRDLKPANVLLGRTGEPDVADFGIAHLLDETLGMSQALTMTPLYTAPEVFDGTDSGTAADVYSLGALLYALLAGRPAHSNEGEQLSMLALMRRVHEDPLPPLPSFVPGPLAALVMRTMSKDPAGRPTSAAALADELARLDLRIERTDVAPVVAAPTLPSGPAAQGRRSGPAGQGRRSGQLLAAAIAVLVLAVGGALVVTRLQQDDPIVDPGRGVVDGPDVDVTPVNDTTVTPDGAPDDGGDDGADDGDGFDPAAALVAADDTVVLVEGFSCTGAEQAVGVVLSGGEVVTDFEILRSPWFVTVTHHSESYVAAPRSMDLNRRLGVVDLVDADLPEPAIGSLEAGTRIVLVEASTSTWQADVGLTDSQRFIADMPLADAVSVDHATPGFDAEGNLVTLAIEGDDELGLLAIGDVFVGWNNVPPRRSCPSLVRDLGGSDADDAASPQMRELLTLQRLSDALAGEQWDLVRTIEPGKASLSDAQFVAGWRPLRQGFVYPVQRTATGPQSASWRLGLIGHETWNGNDLTTLFCVTWDVDLAAGEAGEVVQTNRDTIRLYGSQPGENQRTGFVDPNNLIGIIDETCPL